MQINYTRKEPPNGDPAEDDHEETSMNSIVRLLLGTAAVASVLLIVISYAVFSEFGSRMLRQAALDESQSVARLTFASMYQLMSQGWTREQLLAFTRDASAANDSTSVTVDVYRGPIVSALYGEVRQSPADPDLQAALASGRDWHGTTDTTVRHLYPLAAEAKCLACHGNAKAGDILGVIDVRVEYVDFLASGRRELLTVLLIFSPIPILLALVLVWWVNRRIQNSIDALEAGIDRVNSVSDLRELRFERAETGLAEFNAAFEHVGALADRLRSIAVDKELLEFEIRLLEKFIITSEVVRDWREYVSRLLVEINRVIEAYTLFCIFKVDEEVFDLEVFWHHTPSEATRTRLEARVRAALRQNPHFEHASDLHIQHNVAEPDKTLPELSDQEVALQTKSLLVDTPQIGGIVGIGVNSCLVSDETRNLVLESILSTLLNVVGSIKAIYKYTRDLEYYATRDPLTNLYNQRAFWELAEYEVGRSTRHKHPFALVVIDLDNFKTINDTYGHSLGDEFLQRCSQVMQSVLRAGDVLARYGGDEFVALLPETGMEDARRVAQRLVDAVNEIAISTGTGKDAKSTVSVGIAIHPNHASDLKDLFLFADNMMYKAKAEGKNRLGVPTEEDVVEVFRRIGEKSQIVLNAVERRQVMPYFQPIVGSANGLVEAVEALSRIQLPNDVALGAGEFIEIAEKMGVIHRIDYIVLDGALRQMHEAGYTGLLFVNMSPRALVLSEFIPEVRRIVHEHGIPPERIVFEITERDTVKNISLLESFINELKLEGFRLAIDDFGSGFSSFHYLKRFPIDFIKIEGDFIVNMLNDPQDLAFVRSVSQLAKELGIRSVGEFVESAEVLALVAEVGIDLAQGYHIGRPSPSLREAAKL